MRIDLNPEKTYKTRENAIKAVEKAGHAELVLNGQRVRWVVMQNDEGRYFPAFLGETALQAGMHFKYAVLG